MLTRRHLHPAAMLAAVLLAATLLVPAALARDTRADAAAMSPAASAPLPDVRAIIAAAPPASAFPDADVVVLFGAETIDVDAAGRVTRTVHTVRRLQTQWAMRSESDVRVAWDRTRQDLRVLVARTFMRDGTMVPTPDNGTNEVTPDRVARAVPFLDWRELVISHVGTEPGCVVELVYELRDREPAPLPPGGVCWLGGAHPVLEAEVAVRGAAAVLVQGESAAPDPAPRAGWSTWRLHDLPAHRDPGTGHWRARIVPHVAWSRLADAGALAGALRDAAPAPAATGTDADLAGWLASVREDPGVLTDQDLLDRIAARVHDGIAPVELPGGPWARAPRPASAVQASAVGTDWERAQVLLALLRAAGYTPELGVFGRDAVTPDGSLLVADRLDAVRVVVRAGEENWWLAPGQARAWSGACDLAGWTGIFLAADGGHRQYTVPVAAGRCTWKVHVMPAGDGWSATGDLVLGGPYRPDGADARELAEALAADLLAGGELGELEVRRDTPEELSLRLTATGDALGEQLGDLVVYDLPWPRGGLLDHLPPGFVAEQPEREAPLWIETPGREEVEITVALPAGLVADAPAAAEVHELLPRGQTSRRCLHGDGMATITQVLELLPGAVAADWAQLRSGLAAAERWRQQPLVLRPADPAGD